MVSGDRRAGHTVRFGFRVIYYSVYYNSLPFGGSIANFGIRSFTQNRLGKENGYTDAVSKHYGLGDGVLLEPGQFQQHRNVIHGIKNNLDLLDAPALGGFDHLKP